MESHMTSYQGSGTLFPKPYTQAQGIFQLQLRLRGSDLASHLRICDYVASALATLLLPSVFRLRLQKALAELGRELSW